MEDEAETSSEAYGWAMQNPGDDQAKQRANLLLALALNTEQRGEIEAGVGSDPPIVAVVGTACAAGHGIGQTQPNLGW